MRSKLKESPVASPRIHVEPANGFRWQMTDGMDMLSPPPLWVYKQRIQLCGHLLFKLQDQHLSRVIADLILCRTSLTVPHPMPFDRWCLVGAKEIRPTTERFGQDPVNVQ